MRARTGRKIRYVLFCFTGKQKSRSAEDAQLSSQTFFECRNLLLRNPLTRGEFRKAKFYS